MATAPAIQLTTDVARQVREGPPLVPLALLGGAALLEHPGRPIELLDGAGEFVAWGLVDPENDVVRLLSREEADRPDDAFLRRRMREALALRQRLGLLPEGEPIGSAFRIVNGDGDGLGGVLIDVLGEFAVQWVLSRGLRDWGRRVATALAVVAGELGLRCADGAPWPRGVLQKVRDKAAARPGKPTQSVVFGDSPPARFVVRENGVPFEIHPLAGLNVGLFTDMREHRWRIGRFARDARVLNTFAYTCSLSVAAALAGAAHVTSVDLSSGVLKWAQENFRLAGLDPAQHTFQAADTLRFLDQARREGLEFDLVVLDPPTYSAARAASWSMKNDLPQLVARTLELVPPGGVVWFSGNTHQLSDAELDARLAAGARQAARDISVLETGGLPPDYPTPAGHPESRYLKLRILRAS